MALTGWRGWVRPQRWWAPGVGLPTVNPLFWSTARSLFKKGYSPTEYVGCLDSNVYLESKAAAARGPVSSVQLNGHKPGQAVSVAAQLPGAHANTRTPQQEHQQAIGFQTMEQVEEMEETGAASKGRSQ